MRFFVSLENSQPCKEAFMKLVLRWNKLSGIYHGIFCINFSGIQFHSKWIKALYLVSLSTELRSRSVVKTNDDICPDVKEMSGKMILKIDYRTNNLSFLSTTFQHRSITNMKWICWFFPSQTTAMHWGCKTKPERRKASSKDICLKESS